MNKRKSNGLTVINAETEHQIEATNSNFGCKLSLVEILKIMQSKKIITQIGKHTSTSNANFQPKLTQTYRK